MKDKKLIIFALILTLLYSIGVSVAIYKIVIWEKEHKDCYYETYNQYPCEGATHYARVHRNNNQPCQREKLICKVD